MHGGPRDDTRTGGIAFQEGKRKNEPGVGGHVADTIGVPIDLWVCFQKWAHIWGIELCVFVRNGHI